MEFQETDLYESQVNAITNGSLNFEKNLPDNEELSKLEIIHELCQEDLSQLTKELERLKQTNAKVIEEYETLKKNNPYKEHEVQSEIKEIEEENRDLLKTSENFFSVERLSSNESDKKLLNETFVVLQRKLDKLDLINADLQKKIKKSENDTKNLKKKCENAMGRYKNHDELKEKIKNLEAVAEKYSFIEGSLQKEISEAENRLNAEKAKPENQIDIKTAQKLVSDALEALKLEKNKFSQLENELKEKKNYLQEIKTYGTQSNKITIKLRNELNLVNIVLNEKKEYLSKLENEISDLEIKQQGFNQEPLY